MGIVSYMIILELTYKVYKCNIIHVQIPGNMSSFQGENNIFGDYFDTIYSKLIKLHT